MYIRQLLHWGFLALVTVIPLRAATPQLSTVAHAPNKAALITVSDNWRFDGDLPNHATLISLQGLANRSGPQIYLEYPADWQWEIAGPLIGYLEKRHGIDWQRNPSGDLDRALAQFGSSARGLVVWDKDIRASLIAAYTISGVEDLLVVNEDQLELAARHGLKPVVDLRGKFTGQDDADIYQWAYDEYYARCSRDFYVVLGGHWGAVMQPAIADFGVQQRAFFSDLSANPKHPRELALLNRVLAGQNPASIVLGWHSYGKDTEGQHTTLVGNYGLKMEGLHNLPNVSFTSQIPLTSDFKFTNNKTPTSAASPLKSKFLSATSTLPPRVFHPSGRYGRVMLHRIA